MSRYVAFHKQPIKFNSAPNLKLIAEVVPYTMATIFQTLDAAYERCVKQWGDNGLEHVSFHLAGQPPTAASEKNEEPSSTNEPGLL